MTQQLRDGTGDGFLAKVNNQNQLVVRDVSVQQQTQSAIRGEYYEAHSGLINITDANEIGLISLAPTPAGLVVVIDVIYVDTFASTGGSGSGKFRYYRNPTISGGTTINPVNNNFGDETVLPGTFLKSPTISGGINFATANIASDNFLALQEEKIVVPPGFSFAITITPPAGNLGMDVSANIGMYTIDETLFGKVK